MRILITEDDFAARSILLHISKEYGDVEVAVNGVEAIRAFEDALRSGNTYGLIFMDIMMPEMNGLDAARKIRELERQYKVHPRDEVKIVMATALDSPKTVFEAYNKSGATSYLAKPYDFEAIKVTLLRLGIQKKMTE